MSERFHSHIPENVKQALSQYGLTTEQKTEAYNWAINPLIRVLQYHLDLKTFFTLFWEDLKYKTFSDFQKENNANTFLSGKQLPPNGRHYRLLFIRYLKHKLDTRNLGETTIRSEIKHDGITIENNHPFIPKFFSHPGLS
jgi:hypothetical protein